MHVKPKPKRPAEDWRLQDSEFDELHEQLRFTHGMKKDAATMRVKMDTLIYRWTVKRASC